MWAMKGGHWWWLGFGSMWGGTWKLRGTGGWLQVLCKLGRGRAQRAEARGRGPWQPTESLMKAPGSQDIKSRVCGMFTTQGRSWMQLRMKLPPRTDGEYFPHHCQSTQSRMLTEPTGAKKKKKKSHANCHEIEPSKAWEQRVTRLGVSARVPRSPPPSPERQEKENRPRMDGLRPTWTHLLSLSPKHWTLTRGLTLRPTHISLGKPLASRNKGQTWGA